MPLLVHIPYSPWSVRARLALGAQGVPFTARPYTPTLSEPWLRWRLRRPFGRVTVPALLPDDGPPVLDSLDIVAWGAARSDRPLVTGPEREAIRTWNAAADAMLDAGRARTALRVLDDAEALAESLPPPVRRLGPLGRAIGRDATRRLYRKYGGDARDPAAWHDVLARGLEQLAGALRGREWLLDRFTYADVTMAVGLSFVRPHADAPLGPRSRDRWSEPDLAERHGDLLAWRDRVIARARGR